MYRRTMEELCKDKSLIIIGAQNFTHSHLVQLNRDTSIEEVETTLEALHGRWLIMF